MKSLAAASVAAAALPRRVEAALPKAKITRVRFYQPPNLNQTFNQSNMVVTVETDIGITGVGEGGAKDMLEQSAGSLIGKDPFRIEAVWQEMYMAWFYPPGREKIHALGALDLALWDIKGKALEAARAPDSGRGRAAITANAIHRRRRHCGDKPAGSARAPPSRPVTAPSASMPRAGGPIPDNVYQHARTRPPWWPRPARRFAKASGPNGDWNIDLHQKFDYPDALRCCKLIEEYEPYLVEDPIRDEQFLEDIPRLRQMTTCPLAAGEEWGQRWDFNRLVENHDIDYNRCTLPNVGGITEMLKIMALCETHVVGMVPHFTGPISTAALVNCLSTFPGPVLFEYNYGDRAIDYLPECLDFKQGKVYTNERPGLGATLEMKLLKPVSEVTQPIRGRLYQRPDGSLTHW